MLLLEKILRDKLIPWTKAGASSRIIVARRRMSQATVPSGVKLTYEKIPGKRTPFKGERLYGNTRGVSAKWLEAGMHEVENLRLACVVEGRVNIKVGNYFLGCNQGDFILIPAGIPHPADRHPPHLVTSSLPGRSCELLWMTLYRRGFQCWISIYEADGRRHDPVTENYLFLKDSIIQLFSLLMDDVLGERNTLLCDSLLCAFSATLQREVQNHHYLHPGVVTPLEVPLPDEDDFTAQLESYIRQHLDQSLTLDRVARELYMSRRQLVRRVRQETGQSFVEFLNNYRMEEARTLLRDSEWTAQTIAQFVGFKSPNYFHALFQRRTGCTPGEFRLKTRQAQSRTKKGLIK
jgi:AraC-like DNA-binding protein